MKRPTSSSARLLPLFGAALTLLSASRAQADQFVLMDVTFSFTKEQADGSQPSPSHYYVHQDALGASQPTDWTRPVDYRNGHVHIRTEVLDKPAGGEVTQWSLCYIPHRGIGQGYGCTHSGTYIDEGVYQRDESMTEFWENASIDWTGGIKEMHLVLKDSDGSSGHAHKRADHEKFFPTTVRITLVQVAAGSTYDEGLVPGLNEDATADDQAVDGANGRTTPRMSSRKGCSWGVAATGNAGGWMALLFFAPLALRRRARAAERGRPRSLGSPLVWTPGGRGPGHRN